MTSSAFAKCLVCLVLGLSLSVIAWADTGVAEADALPVVEKTRSSELRAATDVDWQSRSMIRLDRATVEFRKHWQRDLRQRSGIIIREADEQRIKEGVADLVDRVLVNELTGDNGFSLAGEGDAGVVLLVPRVTDLDVIAPDRARNHIGGALTDSQANFRIELEILDAPSGRLLATTSHFLRDPHKGYMEWTTTPTNHRAVRLMLERWAGDLGDWLVTLRVPG